MTFPTVQLLQDDGTGTFPNDVTAFLLGSSETSWTHGRTDEFSTIEPGSLTLTLDNSAGTFTTGTNAISLNQRFRLIVNSINRFTGRVQSKPATWPGGGQSYSEMPLTLIDDVGRLSRAPLRSAVEEDIAKGSPVATYPLSEAAGATLAGDTVGAAKPPLAVTGTGTAMTFGSGIGPTDQLSCATFFGGTFLRNTIPAPYVPASSAWTIECYFTTTTTPATDAFMVLIDGGVQGEFPALTISTAGKLKGYAFPISISSAASVTDGLVHHAALTLTAGGALTLYLDGANVGSTAGVALLTGAAPRFSIAPSDIPVFTAPFVGTVAHATVYNTALSAGSLSTRAQAANDYIGETPAARIARVCGYIGTPTSALDTAGSTLLGVANQTGRDAFTVINEAATADLGVAWINGSGAVTSASGASVAQAIITPAATIDSQWTDEGTSFEHDMTNTVNRATGHATGSVNVTTAQNAFSILVHGIYGTDYEWNVSTDTAAGDRTNWQANTYGGPTPRLAALTIDLFSMDAPTVAAALTLDVFKWLRITNWPSQAPESFSELIIQGITETLTDDSWTLTVTCTRHALYSAWILEAALGGVLDNTTKLYV